MISENVKIARVPADCVRICGGFLLKDAACRTYNVEERAFLSFKRRKKHGTAEYHFNEGA